MQSVALMERQGIPIDTETLGLLRENWDHIRSQLIDRIDVAGVYTEDRFKNSVSSNTWQLMKCLGLDCPRDRLSLMKILSGSKRGHTLVL